MRPKTKNKKIGPLWSKAAAKLSPRAPQWRGTLQRALPLLAPPALATGLYSALSAFHVFSPLYPYAHLAAGGVAALWFWRALRGARGYWAYDTHGRFAFVFGLLVALGGSWGPFGAVDVRVWVTPPAYTTRPTAQLTKEVTDILSGSTIHVGARTDKAVEVFWNGQSETLQPEADEESTLSLPVVAFEKTAQKADLVIHRRWHRLGLWRTRIVPDTPPQIVWAEAPELTSRKTIRLAYEASDDFGVESISVRVTPLSPEAGQSALPAELPLATPRLMQTRGAGYADLTSLPWAGQAVNVQLVATDGAGQKTFSAGKTLTLPARKFRNPFARALIEEREKLLREPGAASRSEAANVMAGIARQQGLFKSDAALYLALRSGAVRLVLDTEPTALSAASGILWQAALSLEEGLMGQSRDMLARTLQDVAQALARGADPAALAPLFQALKTGAQIYYAALENERAKQPEALREMNWLPVAGAEIVAEEDFIARLDLVADLLRTGKEDLAQVRLGEMQKLTENLRTMPPELTPTQDRLAQQVAALRALVRGQKQVVAETEQLDLLTGKTANDRKARGEAMARALARQQALLGALQDLIEQFPETRGEVKDGVRAMLAATEALHAQKPDAARRQQAEAQALLENSALILSEKMRQSLTASGP